MAKKQNLGLSIRENKFGVPYISKASITDTSERLYNSVLGGQMQPSSVAEFFKFIKDVEDRVKKLTDENDGNKFSDLVRDEIEKNSDDGKSITTTNGVKLSLFEAATTYNYKTCGDPIWNSLNAQLSGIQKAIKEREAFLRSIKGFILITVADPETGEMLENIEVSEPTKTSTSTYKAELSEE